MGDIVVSTTQSDKLFYKVIKVDRMKLDGYPTVSLQVIQWNLIADGWAYGHTYKKQTFHNLRKV